MHCLHRGAFWCSRQMSIGFAGLTLLRSPTAALDRASVCPGAQPRKVVSRTLSAGVAGPDRRWRRWPLSPPQPMIQFSDYPFKDVRNFAAGGDHSLLWPEATIFLSHMRILFAAEGRHSCLWLKATMIYESNVPAKIGTSSHTNDRRHGQCSLKWPRKPNI